MRRNNTVVDLFCGCGGFSLGAHIAGFETALAVDIDPTLSGSIPLNFPHSPLANLDLAEVSLRDHPKLEGLDIAGVIGGPPCQGFSAIGKKQESDPRNGLLVHFFRHVKELSPLFFVMENVPGILAEKPRKMLDAAISTVIDEYDVIGPVTLNAADFGAATSRSRVVVIGYKRGYCDPIQKSDLGEVRKGGGVSVGDAIRDLPSPAAGIENSRGFDFLPFPGCQHERLSDYARRARSAPDDRLGWAHARNMLARGLITGNQPTEHSPQVSARYNAVVPGRRDAVSKSFRLEWDKPCPTLRAGTGPDHGSYNAVRPLHPEEGRVITVREAARLQGFPDWFVFHPTKWHSFRMIGNSVSPYMSAAVLGLISERIGVLSGAA